MRRLLTRAALTIVWLLLVALIAIGGAGLVTTLANEPGTVARPELTLEGDRTAAPILDHVALELAGLTSDVDRLGELGRGALTALVSSDFGAIDTAVANGQALAHQVEGRSGQIREELRLLPGTGPNEAILWSPETVRRRDVALTALDATGGLEAAWIRLAAGASVANRLSILLTDHDRIAGSAAAAGRKGNYADALKTLAQAEAKLADAKTLRDSLAGTGIDVTTLTQWIDANARYDAALTHLYNATIAAKGRITKDLRQAAIDERKAHDLLPSNTSGLVIILAEIGRGGLNQAVIGIEQTKARLQAAIDALSAQPGASGEPGEPAASDEPAGSASPLTSVGPTGS
jgi:hypothetical protein